MPQKHSPNDDLQPRLLRSAAVHLALLGGLAGYNYLQGRADTLGDPNPTGGGSVLIQPVNSIPIPSPRGPVQPVANDTKSQVPDKPEPKQKPQPKKPPPPDPDSIALGKRKNEPKRAPEPASTRPPEPVNPNQVTAPGGARATSPMFQVQGAGGVGLGQSNPFGNRFGYYADLIRQRVAQKWQTGAISLRTAPPAIVTFDVRRDGSVGNVRLVKSSGNGQLDYACQRAVIDASPLPPLPAGFERDSATIEFWFQLNK